jgi:ketosteroid isomerase-like protein
MSEEIMAPAREGFAAWQHGDMEALGAMLDPAVTWRWFEPGDWDCRGREDVMQTIRERYEQGFARGEIEFADGGNDAVIVVAHPATVAGPEWPEETATVITFRHGKVTRMQDFRTRGRLSRPSARR